MWFKKELDFDEEKGDNDIDAGDDETLLSHDIKIEMEDTKEDLTSRSKLLCRWRSEVRGTSPTKSSASNNILMRRGESVNPLPKGIAASVYSGILSS